MQYNPVINALIISLSPTIIRMYIVFYENNISLELNNHQLCKDDNSAFEILDGSRKK